MAFQIPDTAKSVAANTAKIYNRHLNRIADITGVDTIEKIVQNPYDVIDTIKLLVFMEEDDTKRKAIARMYFCAVFYVLFGHPYLSDPRNPLRTSFHEFDPTVSANNTKWVKLAAFKKMSPK